jgi:hypothetical protein
MRRTLLSFAAGLALLTANSAVAGENAEAAKRADDDKIICKSQLFVGSRISQRICMRRSEWEAARTNAQKAMDERGKVMKPLPVPDGG